jgi:uncharacterized protein YjlB
VKNRSAETSTGFDGEENPGRVEASVLKGDTIIVPAGVGHRPLEDLSGGDFEMVGSYPNGKNWDMCYGKKGEDKVNGITRLGWFEKDPLYGDDGPTFKV